MVDTQEYKDPENLKNRIKESYDAIAPVYNSWTVPHSPTRMHYVEKLLESLGLVSSSPSPSTANTTPISILELGAGAGVPATERLLNFPNVHVTANDISSTQVSLGKSNLAANGLASRVDWLEGDMSALSFSTSSFDAALGLYSLIHLPRLEQEAMLSKLWTWLRPGGYLLANFAEEPFEGVVMEKWLHEKGWMFWSGFGVEGTLDKVKAAGFEVTFSEVRGDDVDAKFLWVIARKPEQPS